VDDKDREQSDHSVSQINVNELKEIDQDIKNYKLTPSFVSLLKYWVARTKNVQTIRSQIGGLLEELTRKYCEFCGINWGLRAEFVENLEELYSGFLHSVRSRGHRIADIVNWQNYFRANATVRTICYKCSDEIWTRFQYYQQLDANLLKKVVEVKDLSSKDHEIKDNNLRKKTSLFNKRRSTCLISKALNGAKKEEQPISTQISIDTKSSSAHATILKIWLNIVRERRKRQALCSSMGTFEETEDYL
jgi:hypothetical protein